MCGIAGCIINSSPSEHELVNIACEMSKRLEHRGPDDEGVWADASAGVVLAHRRLAILDLSPAGHQPMLSVCQRYVIVFNGEIYNHQDIRRELEAAGHKTVWDGHSDTETLLAALAAWGVERALPKTVGMFAFALWDRKECSLLLGRDRLGEKPLYYGLQNGNLLFSSELKALCAFPGFEKEVDRNALAQFLQYNAVPSPYSIFRGVAKLLPGTWLKVTQQDILNQQLPLPSAYWSLRDVATQGQSQSFTGNDKDAVSELEQLLLQSVSGQMLADVQLGAFLSGGIDSSTIVALMQAQSAKPVKTFTIGFNEAGYDEAKHAHAVADYLGTEHTELYVTPEQMLGTVSRLPELYDEPFADVSQIPTFLVSELARQHVTVSLSGDGGDELFGGYNRYVRAVSIWRKVGWLPRSIRVALAGVLTTLPPATWDKAFVGLEAFLPRGWRYKTPGDKLHKLAEMLVVRSPDEIYSSLISHWKRPDSVVIGNTGFVDTGILAIDLKELEHRMMYLDAISYLPDDILVKVDRAAMGVSLETRVPFLDHRVIEFAWRLPLSMKIRNGEGKWVLRQVLDKYVPRTLIDRPKAGFSVPVDSWLRGPLNGWAQELLNPVTLKQQGYFYPEVILKKWKEHLSGNHNCSHQMWSVLMFQAWQANI